jgi:hypothetical protein
MRKMLIIVLLLLLCPSVGFCQYDYVHPFDYPPGAENFGTGIPPMDMAFSLKPGIFVNPPYYNLAVKVHAELIWGVRAFQLMITPGLEYNSEYFTFGGGIGYGGLNYYHGMHIALWGKVNLVPDIVAIIAKSDTSITTNGVFYYGRYNFDLTFKISQNGSLWFSTGLYFEHLQNLIQGGLYIGIQALCFRTVLQFLFGPPVISHDAVELRIRWMLDVMEIIGIHRHGSKYQLQL